MLKQPVINTLTFSRTADSLSGSILPENFVRLRDFLAENTGRVDYVLSGGMDNYGKPILNVVVRGMITLYCQRCLNKMVHPLDIESGLTLAGSNDELARYDEDSCVDAILASEALDVHALIEDEIILGLPLSPRHPDISCSMLDKQQATQDQDNKPHPFAALKSLKRSRQP
ncbi:MAG: YceD family protein [Nitrosomonas sp.]|nr:YceD family protein [Nitrosomonas sp.]